MPLTAQITHTSKIRYRNLTNDQAWMRRRLGQRFVPNLERTVSKRQMRPSGRHWPQKPFDKRHKDPQEIEREHAYDQFGSVDAFVQHHHRHSYE